MSKQWIVSSFGLTNLQNEKSAINGKLPESKKRRREQLNENATTSKRCNVSAHLNDILWINKYRPKLENELVVNKKKVEEVRNWLKDSFSLKEKCGIILLTGSSGVGKTATINYLSQEMKFGIKEWTNPSGLNYVYGETICGESQFATFREFLLYTSKYSLSQIFEEENVFQKHVVLLEEFPSFIFRDVSEFWEILRCYSSCGKNPLILIVTDDSKDSANERKLLPKYLQEELQIINIAFNQVAVTSVTRCLKRIMDEENVTISPDVLDSLVNNCQGDIRTAVNSLQFTLDNSSVKSSRSISSKHKKSKLTKVDSVNKSSVIALGSRDESLFLLHALGKILHCKRSGNYDDKLSLPLCLKDKERKPLITNPEEVLQRTSTSVNSFCSFLHENYLHFIINCQDATMSTDYLSCADTFNSTWMATENASGVLDPYIFSVASRGVMFCNTEKKGGWQPLHKPKMFDVEKVRMKYIKLRKNIFNGELLRPSDAEIFVELIPYISKIRPRGFSSEQLNFAFSLGASTLIKDNQRNEVDRNFHKNDGNKEKDVQSSKSEMSSLENKIIENCNVDEFEIEEFED